MNKVFLCFAMIFVVVVLAMDGEWRLAENDRSLSTGALAGVASSAREQHQAIKITEDNFEQLVIHGDKPVLLDFWASWCGPCVKLGPTIEQVASRYGDTVLVGKVDVDANQNLAAKYNIRGIPALLFFKDGKVVHQLTGWQSQAKIERDIDAKLTN